MERYSIYHNKACEASERGPIYFGNEHGDPQFLFNFPMKQLIIYTWVEYSEIGIIFRIYYQSKDTQFTSN